MTKRQRLGMLALFMLAACSDSSGGVDAAMRDLSTNSDLSAECPVELVAAEGTHCPTQGVRCGDCNQACVLTCFEVVCYSEVWTREDALGCTDGGATD